MDKPTASSPKEPSQGRATDGPADCQRVLTYPHASLEQKRASTPEEKPGSPLRSGATDDQTRQMQESIQLTTSLLKRMDTQTRRKGLPRPKIEVFDGDVTRFQAFVRAFKYAVEERTDDDREKLHFLEEMTAGTPREIVRGCALLPPGQGYAEAMKILERRFGAEHLVIAGYVRKIFAWPRMQDVEPAKLDTFSILLTNTNNAMRSIAREHRELDNAKTLMEVAGKLPPVLYERWRRKVDSLYFDEDKVSKFADLVDFVEREARVFNNSLFSFQDPMPTTFTPWKEKKMSPSTRGTGPTPQSDECLWCKAQHALADCDVFIAQPQETRWSFTTEKKLCFGCLSGQHRSRSCTMRRTCQECQGNHPTALHRDSTTEPKRGAPSETNLRSAKAFHCRKSNVIPMEIRGDDGTWIRTFAFLDGGSDATYISPRLLSQLKPNNVQTELLKIRTSFRVEEVPSARINSLAIRGRQGDVEIRLPPAFVLQKIPATVEDIVTQEEIQEWPHLMNAVPFPDRYSIPGEATVDILIGNNVPQAYEPLDVIKSTAEGAPFAVRTRVGWVIQGVPLHKQYPGLNVLTMDTDPSEQDLSDMMRNLYDHDLIDLHSDEIGPSQDDLRWTSIVEKGIRKVNGHYEVPLPIKKEKIATIPRNTRQLAVGRMKSLAAKLKRSAKYHTAYNTSMEEMIEKGYAEKARGTPERSYYIPHFGVVDSRKPDKVRVVYDCAARLGGANLNDILYQGPDLTTPLLDVITRFRFGSFGFAADIQKMFYQVRVPERDRDMMRYVWWPQGDINRPVEDLRAVVHLFGAKSSGSIATYALRKTAEDFKDGDSPARRLITHHTYIDDILATEDSEEALGELVTELRGLCASGGFQLHKFVSNSQKLRQNLPLDILAEPTNRMEVGDTDESRVKTLGLSWDLGHDNLQIEVGNEKKPNTKRGVLAKISSVFDPLGMVNPFVTRGKMILQDLYRQKAGWDVPLNDETLRQWSAWLEELQEIEKVAMPRCIYRGSPQARTHQLHHFSDASTEGYSAVTYLRSIFDDGRVQLSFVFGKSRVAPLKQVTVVRLELIAAHLMVQINRRIAAALDKIRIDDIFYWTDSQTVIRYIRNDEARFKIFVANRVSFIRAHSEKKQWRYVATAENPADEGSRGIQTTRWIEGPSFLKMNYLPDFNFPLDESVELEIKLAASRTDTQPEQSGISTMINHYARRHHLTRAVAWVVRLAQCALKRRPMVGEPLTVEEIHDAEIVVIKQAQRDAYRKDIEDIRSKGFVTRQSTLIRLGPFMDEQGMLRVGGRLKNAPVPFDEKFPIVLPGKHGLTTLIIRDYHEKLGHMGYGTVLTNMRARFWVTNGPSCVKRIVRACVICKRVQGRFMQQRMSELPDARLEGHHTPFTMTGVDLFGPYYVKVGRSKCKRYVVLFVCLTTRSTHLEIAHSLDTSSFMGALRRFISRRGGIRVIFSDNASNLAAASKELHESWKNMDHKQIANGLSGGRIEWRFSTPYASHHNGIWERQIRTIRRIFESLLGSATLKDEELLTLFCEVENIMNSRPITVIRDEVHDYRPLTPNSLLNVTSPSNPVQVFTDIERFSRKRWKYVQYMVDVFWKRWRVEYLRDLQERKKWHKTQVNLKEGDIVMVVDESEARCHWPLAIVLNVKQGTDGNVRSVELRGRDSTFWRPISQLVLMLSAENPDNIHHQAN